MRAVVLAFEDPLPPLGRAGIAAFGLWLLGGRRFTLAAASPFGRPLASLAALTVLGIELLSFAVLGSSASLALPLAGLLGRWALVVLAYGSQAAPGDPLAPRLVRQIGFNQFAVASVSAMALTLLLVDAIGLVLLFAIATQTILLRIAVHARCGGITRSALGASAVLGELTIVILSVALVGLRGAFFAAD